MAEGHAPIEGPPLQHPGARRWSPRAGALGALLIVLVPLAMLIAGWASRGVSDLPIPQTRPGRLPLARWETKAPLVTPRDDFGLATVAGRIWVMGGTNGEGGNRLDCVEVYDPATNAWTAGPALSAGRSSFRAVALGTTIYAFGGASSAQPGLDVAEALDTTTKQWRRLAPAPQPLSGHAVAELGGTIYVIGGYSGGNGVGNVYAYEPATNAWRQVASLSAARYNLNAVVLNGKIYALGGSLNNAPSGVVEVYDPATDSWADGTAMPVPMSNFGATAHEGRIYAMAYKIQQVFDPRANRWIAADAMPTSRQGQGVAALADTVYAIGGSNEALSHNVDRVEAYVIGEEDEPDNFQARGVDRGGSIAVVAGGTLTILLMATMLYIGRRRPSRERDESELEGEGEAPA